MPKDLKSKEKEKMKISISNHVEKSEELVKTILELKKNKNLYFQIYDGLKGFDLIMSITGKEELVELFISYMKDPEEVRKNYSSFISYITKTSGKEFLDQLETVYNGILEQYDAIKFGVQASHFGTEEIYLRETLNKVKSILESLGKLKSKSSLINFNIGFLNSKNTNLDFRFNDIDLEQLDFYTRLSDDLEEETSGTNLLPFFHLLNQLMEELKSTQDRVSDMSQEFSEQLSTDISLLEDEHAVIEGDYINRAQKEIGAYLKKKDISELKNIISETENILQNLERNKNLPQSILKKDIETLEKSSDELNAVL